MSLNVDINNWGPELHRRWDGIANQRFDDPWAEKWLSSFVAYLRALADEFERRIDGQSDA